MIDFPASPTNGQQFTAAGVTWVFDGAKWNPAGASSAVAQAIGDNRIINGDMRVDQRNNGASGTASGGCTIDRWFYAASQASKGTWGRYAAGAALTALGFSYNLGFTSSSAYTLTTTDSFSFSQRIEADMVSDFAWGTTGAQPVTLSFWVQSSLTGTFGGAIRNDVSNRSYPFSYSLPVAGTWTRIVVTIPGDTGGTWVMSGNGIALQVVFDLGTGATYRGPAGVWAATNYVGVTGAVSVVATNAATFYLTGVKLEIGSVATPFNRQSLTKSLADCQRYYQTLNGGVLASTFAGAAGAAFYASLPLPTQMRATPTVAYTNMAYGNASGITSNSLAASFHSAQVTATAVGIAWAAGTVQLTAEL